MTSTLVEPPTLRSLTSYNRRSYSCYNCNHAFHITPTTSSTSTSSPSSFRCPRCFHRHLIPNHTVSPPPPPPVPPPPPPQNNFDYPAAPGIFTYYTSDEFDSDYDYDSDSSLLSFTIPSVYPPVASRQSYIDSLPVKILTNNSTEPVQSCTICIEDFGNDKDKTKIVNELPCEHYFHKSCISEWLSKKNTCPLCRFKLPLDPVPDQLESIEYDEVLVVDLGFPVREPVLRRVSAESSLTSVEAAAEAAEIAALDTERRGFDAMHDEDDDGDTLMMDV